MNELKWILIDEYQDFSWLFHQLLSAIRTFNPDVKVFCVGDDWQAINSFAGSDLIFFHDFNKYINPAEICNLVTNFRSEKEIISAGNALMKGNGNPSKNLPKKDGGEIHIRYVDDMWVEQRNEDAFANDRKDDERFLITRNEEIKNRYRLLASKYLKICYEIFKYEENSNRAFAILDRTNYIDGIGLDRFKQKLVKCIIENDDYSYDDISRRIKVKTVHRFKGLEADVVIILEANNHVFPLIHPDNSLFWFFGGTMHDIIEEERRLFYVGLTRTKTTLYLISERERESDFIEEIYKNDPSLTSFDTHGKRNNTNNYPNNKTERFITYDIDDDIPF